MIADYRSILEKFPWKMGQERIQIPQPLRIKMKQRPSFLTGSKTTSSRMSNPSFSQSLSEKVAGLKCTCYMQWIAHGVEDVKKEGEKVSQFIGSTLDQASNYRYDQCCLMGLRSAV